MTERKKEKKKRKRIEEERRIQRYRDTERQREQERKKKESNYSKGLHTHKTGHISRSIPGCRPRCHGKGQVRHCVTATPQHVRQEEWHMMHAYWSLGRSGSSEPTDMPDGQVATQLLFNR